MGMKKNYFSLTCIACDLRCGIGQSCQERGFSCIWEPIRHKTIRISNVLIMLSVQMLTLLSISPYKPQICNELEVKPYVFSLAFRGLKGRVEGAS